MTDEKPCPLTRGEWLALLAAESQAKFGYKHLVFAVMLTAYSILIATYMDGATYIATRFGSFGDPMQLVWIVVFCAILALFYRICHVESLVNMFKEEDKNPEIIKEIISGKFADPDEIRKQWEKNHDSPENAKELLKICENQIETRWKIVKFLTLTWYSFTNNFKAITKNIHFDTPDASETEKFIAVCENRRARAKILLSEIGPLIGFGVATMVGVALFARETVHISMYISLLIFLFLCLAFLFILLAHYRTQVHAWTAFEEGAILQKPPA